MRDLPFCSPGFVLLQCRLQVSSGGVVLPLVEQVPGCQFISQSFLVDKSALPGQSDGLVIVVHNGIGVAIQNPHPLGFHQVMLVPVIRRGTARQLLQRLLIVVNPGEDLLLFPLAPLVAKRQESEGLIAVGQGINKGILVGFHQVDHFKNRLPRCFIFFEQGLQHQLLVIKTALFMIDELCTRHPVVLIHDATRQARRFIHQNRDRLRQHFGMRRPDNIIDLLESKLQRR